MLSRVDRIVLTVPAIPGAVRYYRDCLGLKLIKEEKQAASFLMSDGKTEIILRADPDQPTEEIYYLVENVRDLYQRRAALQLKFIQTPRPATRGYRAAIQDPFGNVLLILDRTTELSAPTTIEDTAAPGALFAGIEEKVTVKPDALIQSYVEVGRTADDLPYTPHFEKLFGLYTASFRDPKPTRREAWRHLLNLRKAGKLPKLGEARSDPPQVPPESTQKLRALLGKDIGKRDRLPYTDRFDALVDAFNQSQDRPLSPHLIWRLVAKLAK
jgi:catechol 2,3-dioxygenase-like lactoylglutathione lyase family enzyme